MSGLIIWLVIGGSIGWIASVVMRTDAQQGILINIVAGIVGVYVGVSVIVPFLRVGGIGSYFIAVLSSVFLVSVVNLLLCRKFR